MQPKYTVDQRVKFTYKGKEYEGKIQGIKEGPLYLIWVGDKYGWVREGLIIGVN
jgi:hypothetical protein